MHAPRRPLKAGSIYDVANRRFVALGIDAAHRGGHALRHACASRLLAEGLSIKEIGDHLGHRSAASTSIYAKNMQALREVGAFDVGGLLMLTHVVDAYLAKQRSLGARFESAGGSAPLVLPSDGQSRDRRSHPRGGSRSKAKDRSVLPECCDTGSRAAFTDSPSAAGTQRSLHCRQRCRSCRRNKRPMFIPQKNYTSCWTRPRS
ncbi:tyrosine-type recombinase/integrase [Bradyrhizobium sp. LA6.10]|uniref:tyrosine-type recombinase/integrase n=1 Tax=Bradyrhizobium sp. LA6.10 TaxID=3156318 RepID=UPI00339731A6